MSPRSACRSARCRQRVREGRAPRRGLGGRRRRVRCLARRRHDRRRRHRARRPSARALPWAGGRGCDARPERRRGDDRAAAARSPPRTATRQPTSAGPADYKRHLAGELTARALRAAMARAAEDRRADMQVTVTVNGEERHAGSRAPTAARPLPPRRARPHRHALGVRHVELRHVRACWMDGEPVKCCTVLAAMADGHEVRTVEGLEQGGELDPVQQGFIERARPAVRVLHPGHDDDRPCAARPQPRPDRGGDPRGDLRATLPLHRLREHRAVDPMGRRHRRAQEVTA